MAKEKCPMDKSKRKELKQDRDRTGLSEACREAGCVLSPNSYSQKKYDVLPGVCLFG